VPPTVPQLTAADRLAIDRYLDELDVWNRRLNLTAVPRDRAWDRHVVESLELLDAAAPGPGARCADLGSGAGIPGVIVALVRPDLAVTLVESDRRKAGFLVHVCGLLGLDHVTVAGRRAEQLAADPEHAHGYDAVLSRAAARPGALWQLAAPLLRSGGALWALVSQADADAVVAALNGRDGLRVENPRPGILAVRQPG
jgi:16S rRNA (guanine527-N7)-methyltransferase